MLKKHGFKWVLKQCITPKIYGNAVGFNKKRLIDISHADAQTISTMMCVWRSVAVMNKTMHVSKNMLFLDVLQKKPNYPFLLLHNYIWYTGHHTDFLSVLLKCSFLSKNLLVHSTGQNVLPINSYT